MSITVPSNIGGITPGLRDAAYAKVPNHENGTSRSGASSGAFRVSYTIQDFTVRELGPLPTAKRERIQFTTKPSLPFLASRSLPSAFKELPNHETVIKFIPIASRIARETLFAQRLFMFRHRQGRAVTLVEYNKKKEQSKVKGEGARRGPR